MGSGRIRAAHGDIPVPVPAVARLAVGWPTVTGELLPPRGHAIGAEGHGHGHDGRRVPPGVAPGIGELTTPTGMALLRALADRPGPQPALQVEAIGLGAGTKDTPGLPNVVRVFIGRAWQGQGVGAAQTPVDADDTPTRAVQLEANVDDLDPRLWPGVVDSLLSDGALDAWLTPIVMKGGRPAVTVHALVRTGDAPSASERIMALTGSLGVRRHVVERSIRTRSFEEVALEGHRIRGKVARDTDGVVRRREPEFRDVAAAARALGMTERQALAQARALCEEDR
nr:LarC family nickel insertion protein [Brachybacterium sillae]